MTIYTIGFTKRTAQDFFETLNGAGIRRLIDVRLNNTSQLAAFTKKDDLRYLLKAITGADYVHEPLLAPTDELLSAYKKAHGSWETYEHGFLELVKSRHIESTVDRGLFEESTVLLCSEFEPHHCHRRLVAEYLSRAWSGVQIQHL